jgi:hypothetical protein
MRIAVSHFLPIVVGGYCISAQCHLREYIVADNKPVELAYHWVPTEQRPLYDAAVDSLSLDYCLKEIEQCSSRPLKN